MARALLERELAATHKGRVHFDVATRADDAEIRRLLRENPMPGKISLSLEREPDYFADAKIPGEAKQTIIARENGRIVCVGSCVIRQRFVNGESRRVAYLGGLRLDVSQAGRFDILRRGYEFFRELQTDAPADFYFTSIAAENDRARKLLERGLPGMPQYEFIGEFVTVLLSTARRTRLHTESKSRVSSAGEFIARLNEQNRLYQFAPSWSSDELIALETLGLRPNNFNFVRREGKILAGAAVWDQRIFKQTVIRDYGSSLASLRRVYKIGARMFNWPQLPDVGTVLANAFVSLLIADVDRPEILIHLVSELCGVAAQCGIKLLTVGFAGNDPRLITVRRRFGPYEYRSRLYIVRWPEIGSAPCELNNQILAPEVALL